MLITPLNALRPKNAELAPETISTFIRSSSRDPKKFPNAKFNPGEALSTPSIICRKSYRGGTIKTSCINNPES